MTLRIALTIAGLLLLWVAFVAGMTLIFYRVGGLAQRLADALLGTEARARADRVAEGVSTPQEGWVWVVRRHPPDLEVADWTVEVHGWVCSCGAGVLDPVHAPPRGVRENLLSWVGLLR